MTARAQLMVAVDDLEKLLRDSAIVPDEEFNDRRREEIEFRRRITEQNIRISAIGEIVFAAEGSLEEFRKVLGKLRHAVALHAGSWPVVLIELDNAQYKVSVQQQRDAYRQFFQWIRNA